MITPRETAISHIKTLIDEHQFTPKDILPLFHNKEETQSGSLLQRVMIYIGGVFIFMGLCVYTGIIWHDLNSFARVVISLGSGLIAFILGRLTMHDTRYSRATTPLFIIAASLIPVGLYVTLDEFFAPTGDRITPSLVVFGITLAQFAIGFLRTNRTSLLFFSLCYYYAILFLLLAKFHIDPPEGPLVVAATSLLVCWGIDKTSHKAISPFFYFWGGALTAAAAFDELARGPFDVLLIGVAAALIYLCTLNNSRTLLTVGVISLLGYLGYFTDEYFKDIVGWPIALIVMGFVMMGISVFAVKLGRKIATTEA